MTNSALLHRFFHGVPHHFIGRPVHIDRHRVNTPGEPQRTHNLLIGRQSDEGGFRSEPRHCPSGSTRLGAAQDCRRSDISRCLTRCVSKCSGDPIFDRVPVATLVPTKSRCPAAVTGLPLGAGRNFRHRLNNDDRVMANRSLPRQHDRISSIKDRICHVACLRPSWHRSRNHRLKHLGRRDHRNTPLNALTNDHLLKMWNLFKRAVDTEITTCHHHPIRGRHNVGESSKRSTRLNFRNELGPVTHHLANLIDITRSANERHGDELDPGCCHLLGKEQVIGCWS